MKFTFLFLFASITCYSQSKTARGIVLDELSQKPIPYVNISILESSNGTSSDDKGSFQMEIKDDELNKQVHLSSLGYIDSIISVENLIKSGKIFLKAKIEQLNEVVISKKFDEKFLVVNPIKKKKVKVGFGAGTKPWKIALFFPFKEEYKSLKYLKEVEVFFAQSIIFKARPSKFRLRIFSVDDLNMPNNDLLLDDVIIETKSGQRQVKIDLSKFNLTFPESGIFISLEGLAIPFNAYEETMTSVDSTGKKTNRKGIRYAPTFGGFYDDINRFRTFHFFNGEWYEYQFKGSKLSNENHKALVPAISLTLSN